MIPRRTTVLPLAVAAVVSIALGVSSCGSDEVEPSTASFCKHVEEQQQAILNPPLGNNKEIVATLEFYELMGQLAPLAISEQWQSMITLLETADTVVPSDPESVQRVAKQAYATEKPAYEISVWVQRNCGITLPVATIVPHDVPLGGDTSGIITVAPNGVAPASGSPTPVPASVAPPVAPAPVAPPSTPATPATGG